MFEPSVPCRWLRLSAACGSLAPSSTNLWYWESSQGMLKSTALRVLCPVDDWFSDDLPLGVDSKQVIERTVGKWIIEAAEMHGNRGREAEALKGFLSRQVDGPVRLAYPDGSRCRSDGSSS